MISLLLRIGLVTRRANGSVRWPVSVCRWHTWKWLWRTGNYVGRFRNLPGVVKWLPGRLLPRRWGFYVLGLEIGDRG